MVFTLLNIKYYANLLALYFRGRGETGNENARKMIFY